MYAHLSLSIYMYSYVIYNTCIYVCMQEPPDMASTRAKQVSANKASDTHNVLEAESAVVDCSCRHPSTKWLRGSRHFALSAFQKGLGSIRPGP